ncbi:MAG: SDR family oxidoreductase [Firmicutes bacterium]|nr:SDR family oxidoreductase [Bacillota bacterium]
MTRVLEGKGAVIVGAAGRIGRAVAEAYLLRGADVLAVDRRGSKLEFEMSDGKGDGDTGRLTPVVMNITDPEDCRELVKVARETLKSVDILVNCPGYIHRAPFTSHPADQLDELWNANVKTVFFLSQAFGAFMAEQGRGKIINFSSVGGLKPEVGHSAYCAAKAAVIAFSRVAALELAPRNVQVNIIAPGPTETIPFTSPFYLEHPEVLRKIEEATPAGRIGHPEDHVGLAVFLASDESRWVTGQVILSDGGLGLV